MNFYKHYIGDFQRDTGHLSLTERGAYLALIHHYYATEKPLPKDHTSLCRIAGAITKQERDAVKVVMSFFECVESGLMHKRIEAEIQKAVAVADTNREIALAREAKRRAEKEARKEHEKSTNRAPSVPRSEHEKSTNQTPDTREELKAPQPPVPGGVVVPVRPRRKSEAMTFKAFFDRAREKGEKAITDYTPVWQFAESAAIPREFIELCWLVFRNRYGPGGAREAKRYSDWRKTFRNAVEDNWFKLWSFDAQGQCFLTAQGRQHENTLRGAA